MKFRVGQAVRYMHWGEKRTGVIARIGKGVVFLADGRWLHFASITAIS